MNVVDGALGQNTFCERLGLDAGNYNPLGVLSNPPPTISPIRDFAGDPQ